MLNAFWRVASSVLRIFFAMTDALVFLRAIVLSALTSLEVQARRFFFLFATGPSPLCSSVAYQHHGKIKTQ
jgi:hypothetical protein